MGYEERMDAMSDYNSEQQGEGRDEVLGELKEYFSLQPQKLFTKDDIISILDGF